MNAHSNLMTVCLEKLHYCLDSGLSVTGDKVELDCTIFLLCYTLYLLIKCIFNGYTV